MLGKWGVTNCYLYSRPTVFLMDSTIYVCNYKGIWLATNSNSLMMKKFTLTSNCFRSNFPIYHKALIKISFTTFKKISFGGMFWKSLPLILNKKLKSLKCIQWIYVCITCLGIKQLCKTNIAILRYIMEIPTIDPPQ